MDDDQVMHAMSLDDMYHVERVLARGVGGVTELVTIEGSGPFVRKKIPLREANRSVWSACADCGSKRLPHVEAMYELPDEFVVVYDFVPGDSVERLVRTTGSLPPERAASLAGDLCEAAGALHARGIIHRDIAPTNVIVSGDGAHLIDLGIARMYEDGAAHDENALGTWGYASPEQYGFAQTDPRSDIYSIGRLLAYLACGVASSEDGFDEALEDEKVVPPALRAVIDKATSFEPSARYQSAQEMAAALAGLGQAQPPAHEATHAETPADPGPGKAASGRGRRSRRWVPIVCTCGVALVALVATLAFICLHTSGGGETAAPSNGPSHAAAGNATSAPTSDDMLQVSGLEWNTTSKGTLIYLVSLTNTSDDLTAELPSVTLTGTDAQGNVTLSKDVYFESAYPGETVSMAGFVSDAGSTTDVASSLNRSTESPRQVPRDQRVELSVGRTSLSRDELGNAVATGSITRGADGGGDSGTVRTDVVFRDAAGRLVGLGEDYPSMPEGGGSTSFRAFDIVGSDEVTSYEVYANPWG